MKQKRFISCVGVRLLTLIAAVLLMGQTAKAENYGQSSNPSPIPLHRVRAPSIASEPPPSRPVSSGAIASRRPPPPSSPSPPGPPSIADALAGRSDGSGF